MFLTGNPRGGLSLVRTGTDDTIHHVLAQVARHVARGLLSPTQHEHERVLVRGRHVDGAPEAGPDVEEWVLVG